MILDKAALLAARPGKVKEIEVPEWGGSVYVRALSARDALALGDQLKASTGASADLLPIQLAAFLANADGSALVTVEEAAGLLDSPPLALKAVIEAGMALNDLGEDPKGN